MGKKHPVVTPYKQTKKKKTKQNNASYFTNLDLAHDSSYVKLFFSYL